MHRKYFDNETNYICMYLLYYTNAFLSITDTKDLDKKEKQFWEEVLLKTDLAVKKEGRDDQEKKKVLKQDLNNLRNTLFAGLLVINAIFVTIVYVLTQINSYKNRLSFEISCPVIDSDRADTLLIEPIPIAFTIVFGLILFIQAVGMLFHRLLTFSHIMVRTEIYVPIKEGLTSIREGIQRHCGSSSANISESKGGSKLDEFIKSGKTGRLPVPEEKVKDKPVPTEKVKDKPVPAEKVKDKPVPAEKVKDKPVPAEKVKDKPVPAEKVKDKPVDGGEKGDGNMSKNTFCSIKGLEDYLEDYIKRVKNEINKLQGTDKSKDEDGKVENHVAVEDETQGTSKTEDDKKSKKANKREKHSKDKKD